jgi:hypothetical protein
MADADKFCQKRSLQMKVVSAEGVNGQDFGHNTSFKLVFRGIPINSTSKP